MRDRHRLLTLGAIRQPANVVNDHGDTLVDADERPSLVLRNIWTEYGGPRDGPDALLRPDLDLVVVAELAGGKHIPAQSQQLLVSNANVQTGKAAGISIGISRGAHDCVSRYLLVLASLLLLTLPW